MEERVKNLAICTTLELKVIVKQPELGYTPSISCKQFVNSFHFMSNEEINLAHI